MYKCSTCTQRGIYECLKYNSHQLKRKHDNIRYYTKPDISGHTPKERRTNMKQLEEDIRTTNDN